MSAVRPPAPPKREDVAEPDLPDFDLVYERCADKFGGFTPYHGAIVNSPPFGAALNRLGRLARTAGDRDDTYSHADREFVDQVLSADWGTNVLQRIHLPDAVATGIRPEAIDAIRNHHEEDLTEDEHFLASYIRQVVGGEVTDESFGRMVDRLGRRGAVEYTIFIAFLQMTLRLWQAFGMEDPDDAEMDAMLEGYLDGSQTAPDFRDRIG